MFAQLGRKLFEKDPRVSGRRSRSMTDKRGPPPDEFELEPRRRTWQAPSRLKQQQQDVILTAERGALRTLRNILQGQENDNPFAGISRREKSQLNTVLKRYGLDATQRRINQPDLRRVLQTHLGLPVGRGGSQAQIDQIENRLAAIDFLTEQNMTERYKDVDEKYWEDWMRWMMGRGPKEEYHPERTPWGREVPQNDEVVAYLRSFPAAKGQFMAKLAELRFRGPQNLTEYFLWYKYFVRLPLGGVDPNDEFLKDWHMFFPDEQERRQNGGDQPRGPGPGPGGWGGPHDNDDDPDDDDGDQWGRYIRGPPQSRPRHSTFDYPDQPSDDYDPRQQFAHDNHLAANHEPRDPGAHPVPHDDPDIGEFDNKEKKQEPAEVPMNLDLPDPGHGDPTADTDDDGDITDIGFEDRILTGGETDLDTMDIAPREFEELEPNASGDDEFLKALLELNKPKRGPKQKPQEPLTVQTNVVEASLKPGPSAKEKELKTLTGIQKRRLAKSEEKSTSLESQVRDLEESLKKLKKSNNERLEKAQERLQLTLGEKDRDFKKVKKETNNLTKQLNSRQKKLNQAQKEIKELRKSNRTQEGQRKELGELLQKQAEDIELQKEKTRQLAKEVRTLKSELNKQDKKHAKILSIKGQRANRHIKLLTQEAQANDIERDTMKKVADLVAQERDTLLDKATRLAAANQQLNQERGYLLRLLKHSGTRKVPALPAPPSDPALFTAEEDDDEMTEAQLLLEAPRRRAPDPPPTVHQSPKRKRREKQQPSNPPPTSEPLASPKKKRRADENRRKGVTKEELMRMIEEQERKKEKQQQQQQQQEDDDDDDGPIKQNPFKGSRFEKQMADKIKKYPAPIKTLITTLEEEANALQRDEFPSDNMTETSVWRQDLEGEGGMKISKVEQDRMPLWGNAAMQKMVTYLHNVMLDTTNNPWKRKGGMKLSQLKPNHFPPPTKYGIQEFTKREKLILGRILKDKGIPKELLRALGIHKKK